MWINKKTEQRVPGSAAIALKHSDEFTHMFFIEKNSRRAERLRSLIHDHNADNKASVLIGDCNELMPSILSKIHPSAPTFVFLDPSALQLRWKTIEVLSRWKTELLILFPLRMAILRLLPTSGQLQEWARERLNAVFWTNEWEKLYHGRHRTYVRRDLLKLYTDRLTALGYPYVLKSDIFKSDSGRLLYYLIWVGKHPVGKKIMDHVFEHQSPQLKLF